MNLSGCLSRNAYEDPCYPATSVDIVPGVYLSEFSLFLVDKLESYDKRLYGMALVGKIGESTSGVGSPVFLTVIFRQASNVISVFLASPAFPLFGS